MVKADDEDSCEFVPQPVLPGQPVSQSFRFNQPSLNLVVVQQSISMQIEVYARCYNIYGGHASLGYIGDFLIGRQADFGTSVQKITITFHFRTSGSPRKTLEQNFERFHAYLGKLPKVTFRRKKAKIEIDVASALIDGRDWKAQRGVLLDLFVAGVPEVIAALKLCRKRLKPDDEFELDLLLNTCQSRLNELPKSQQELDLSVAQWKIARQEQLSQMSPWERLGIDWDDYHSDSRELLDDVFYWNCSHDFAPHGNDTGADLLADYIEHCRRKPLESGEYLERLAKSWGYGSFHEMDDISLNQSKVALAFAELKVHGCLYDDSLRLALEGLASQKESAESAVDWPHREERLKTITMLSDKLIKLDEKDVQRRR